MYDGTYALGGSLTVITGAVVVPATDGLGDSQPLTLNKPTSMQEIQNVYVGLSLKPVVQKLPERITSTSSLKTTQNRNYKDISKSTVGIPNVIL